MIGPSPLSAIINLLGSTSLKNHPHAMTQFRHATTGAEVVEAFRDRVKGKISASMVSIRRHFQLIFQF